MDSPRVDLLIARHGRPLAIALVAIGLLALVATGWVFATPPTTTTTETVNEETVSTDVTTTATVVEDGIWSEGDELENSPVYLFEATPELTLEVATAVPSRETTAVHEVDVVYRAERDGEVFWEQRERKARTTADVENGTATSTTTINATDVHGEYRDAQQQLDGVGSVEVLLVVGTEYETGTYEGTLTGESAMEFTERSYWIADSLSASQEHSETTTADVTESPNLGLVGALAGIAILSFGLAAFVGSRTDIDEEAARLAVHKQRYDDWISNGSLPMWIGDHHVSLDSLEDVVDVAIDTNERVVHDDQRGLFAVVDDDVVYYYSDRGLWEETAWPDMTFPNRDADVGEDVPPIEDAEPPAIDDTEPAPSIEDVDDLEWSDDEEPDFSDDDDVWRQL